MIFLIIFGVENNWHDNWLNLQGNMRRTIVIHAFLILSCIVHAQDTVVTVSDTTSGIYFLLKTATYRRADIPAGGIERGHRLRRDAEECEIQLPQACQAGL